MRQSPPLVNILRWLVTNLTCTRRAIWLAAWKDRLAMDRTQLLGAVLEKLEAVVILLTAAGEQTLAACTENLAQKIKAGAEEEKESPAFFIALRKED